jgi:hypothetical protein
MMTFFLFLHLTHTCALKGKSRKGYDWIELDAFVFIRTSGKAERCVVVVTTSDWYSGSIGFEFRLLVNTIRGLDLKLYEYLKYITSKVLCISCYTFSVSITH